MKYYNLILNLTKKINFKKKSNLVFFDEYLFKLYDKNDLDKYNTCYLNKTFNRENFFEKKSFFLKKKNQKYIKELSKILNKVHNTKHSLKYWSIIIEYFTSVLTFIILLNYTNLKKNKKYSLKIKKNLFHSFRNTNEFVNDTELINSNAIYITRYKILEIFLKKKIKFINSSKNKEKEDEKYLSGEKNYFFKKIIIFFIRLFVLITKPILILDGYMGRKNAFKIFLKSYFRILCIPSSLFFYKSNLNNYNSILRKNLEIKKNDKFDKIFNYLIKYFLPLSYLENYKYYYKESEKFSKIKILGSAINLFGLDNYTYLAASVLKKKGKLITFEHGGFQHAKKKENINEVIEKKYSSKIFFWNDQSGLGMNYLSRYKKKYSNSNTNKKISIIQTYLSFNIICSNGEVPDYKNHPRQNYLYTFYDHLDQNIKKEVCIKIFPADNYEYIKKIWIKKFGVNLKLLDNSFHKDHYYNSRLLILDDLSTPLVEALFIGTPFIIIINKKNLTIYKKKYLNIFNFFYKKKILFNSSKEASMFINQNIQNIDIWWKKISIDKNFANIKKNIFSDKYRFVDKIVKELNNLKK